MATWVFDSSTFRQILEYYMNNVEIAYDKGYRVVDGKVLNWKGDVLKTRIFNKGYEYLRIRLSNPRKMAWVGVHRLVAFQKFGKKMLEKGIQVRHLDGNPLNNLEYNIEIGTASQNHFDKSPEVRMSASINAARHLRRFSDEIINKMKKMRYDGYSYKDIAKEFGLKDGQQASYYINREYKTKK